MEIEKDVQINMKDLYFILQKKKSLCQIHLNRKDWVLWRLIFKNIETGFNMEEEIEGRLVRRSVFKCLGKRH